MTKKEAALFCGAVVLAVILAGWRYLAAPLINEASLLRREYAALLIERSHAHERLRRLTALSDDWERWRPRAGPLDTLIPAAERLPESLARLETLIDAAPVAPHTLKFGAMKIEEMESGGAYAAVAVKLRARGDAWALLDLLERLERFEQLLLLDQISWSRGEAEEAALELDFRLIFYPPP